jgi:RNA polymerase sigma factor (sigma-70 family)
LWAADHYRPCEGGDFQGWARSCVRLIVRRAVSVAAARFHRRPTHIPIDALPDDGDGRGAADGVHLEARRDDGASLLPLELSDLPPDLRDAVRLFYIDNFDLRECGLLLGCSMETVRQRLSRAARILCPHATPPARRNGEKRLQKSR